MTGNFSWCLSCSIPRFLGDVLPFHINVKEREIISAGVCISRVSLRSRPQDADWMHGLFERFRVRWDRTSKAANRSSEWSQLPRGQPEPNPTRGSGKRHQYTHTPELSCQGAGELGYLYSHPRVICKNAPRESLIPRHFNRQSRF